MREISLSRAFSEDPLQPQSPQPYFRAAAISRPHFPRLHSHTNIPRELVHRCKQPCAPASPYPLDSKIMQLGGGYLPPGEPHMHIWVLLFRRLWAIQLPHTERRSYSFFSLCTSCIDASLAFQVSYYPEGEALDCTAHIPSTHTRLSDGV